MSSETYQILARTLCMRYPLTPVHCRADRAVVPHSIPLNRQAVFYYYIIINGKRYYGSRTVGSNRSSFVHVIIPQRTGQNPLQLHGEVLEIFQIDQISEASVNLCDLLACVGSNLGEVHMRKFGMTCK
jgi:hypothetical protein